MARTVFITLYIISAVCLWILLSAIVLNFYLSKKDNVKKVKKTFVETGSMLAFFIVMALLVYIKFGAINLNQNLSLAIAIIGTALILIGTIINITGRLALKSNWGNYIKIYEHHTLTTNGIYRYIRHPLYSSTILMIYGFSLLFINYWVLIFNIIIFIPFMIYRAKQEEELLALTFKDEYAKYKSKTGLLIPKVLKGESIDD